MFDIQFFSALCYMLAFSCSMLALVVALAQMEYRG